MKFLCQVLVVLLLTLGLLVNLHWDVNGKPAKGPGGLGGILGTIFVTALLVAVYYFAGAFSEFHLGQ